MKEPIDPIGLLAWIAVALFVIAFWTAVGYFVQRAVSAPKPEPNVVCAGPETAGGPTWGISTMTCDSR